MNTPPVATYRLQLNKDQTLGDAAALVPYLDDLRISHLYLSPVLESTAGSNHGYDGTDFSKISEERGGEEGFAELDNALSQSARGLKSILDIVPNHMGIGGRNPYWEDVLKHGPQSAHWNLFDIRADKNAPIRLPFLDKPLPQQLEEGTAQMVEDAQGGIGLRLGDRFLPFRTESEDRIRHRAQNRKLSIQDYLSSMSSSEIADYLEEQHYTLTNTDDVSTIDYRRFFHIFELIGLRVEDSAIYDKVHAKLKDMAAQYPSIDGVRVDHIDGLYDPTSYLQALNSDFPSVWVEKILTGKEDLLKKWPVEGTTGYEFIQFANHLMVDRSEFDKIENYWKGRIQDRWKNFADCVADCKDYVLHTLFPSELKRLVELSAKDEAGRKKAEIFWSGITASMPVYRTYATKESFSEVESYQVWRASEKARKRYGRVYGQTEALFLPALMRPLNDKERQARLEWQQLTGPVIAKGLEDTAHYRYNPLAAFNEVGCEPVQVYSSDNDVFKRMNERAAQNPHTLNATSTHDTKRSEDARHRLYALADDADKWFSFYEKATEINAEHSRISGGRWLDKPTEYFFYQAVISTWPLDGVIDAGYIKRLQDYMHKATHEAAMQTSWPAPDHVYDDHIQNFVVTTLTDEGFTDHMKSFIPAIAAAGAVNSLAVQTLKILGPGIPDIYQGTETWDFSLVDPDNRRPVDFELLRQTMTDITAFDKQEGRAALLGKLTAEWKDGAVKQWLTQQALDIRRSTLSGKDNIGLHKLKPSGDKARHLLAACVSSGKTAELVIALPRYPTALLDHPKDPALAGLSWGDTSFTLPDTGKEWHELLRGKDGYRSGSPVRMKELSDFPVAVFRPV